jgi:hypothetical protein
MSEDSDVDYLFSLSSLPCHIEFRVLASCCPAVLLVLADLYMIRVCRKRNAKMQDEKTWANGGIVSNTFLGSTR